MTIRAVSRRTFLQVYRDAAMWQRLSAGGLSYIENNLSRKLGMDRVREILEIAAGNEPQQTKRAS